MKKRQFICVLAALLILPTVLVAFLHSKKIVPPGMQRVYLCTSATNSYEKKTRSTTVCTYDSQGNMLTRQYTFYLSGSTLYRYTYDGENRLLTEKAYNSDGKLTYCKDYTYDTHGMTVKEQGYFKGHPLYYYYLTTYDSHGTMLVNSRYEQDVEVYRHENAYDANGNLLTSTYCTEGIEEYLYEYTYDTNGNMLTSTYYEKGVEMSREEKTYNEHNKPLTHTFYSRGYETSRIEKTYDSNGNLLTDTSYVKFKETSVSYYSYDSSGNITDEKIFSYGDLVSHTQNTYGASGNLLSSSVTNQNGTTNTRYSYDSNNRKRSMRHFGDLHQWSYNMHGFLQEYTMYRTWRGELTLYRQELYTYTELLLPIEQAKKVLEWQEEIFGHLYFP